MTLGLTGYPHAPTPTRCLPSEPFENTAQVTAWMLRRVRMRWHQISAHYTVLSSQWVKPMGPLKGNGSRPGPSDLIGDFALSCHCTLSLLGPDLQRENASTRVRSKDSIKL